MTRVMRATTSTCTRQGGGEGPAKKKRRKEPSLLDERGVPKPRGPEAASNRHLRRKVLEPYLGVELLDLVEQPEEEAQRVLHEAQAQSTDPAKGCYSLTWGVKEYLSHLGDLNSGPG